MQLSHSLTPCQKLQQAWTEFNAASSPETRVQKQIEMIALLKDSILGFSSDDADNLRKIAETMKLNSQVDPELSESVAELANRLARLSLGSLPNEMMAQALSLVPPMNRFGIHCCNQMWGAESRNPRYLAALVNRPDHPMPLDRLPRLLAKCSSSVLHMDCSRLLTHDDRQKMTGDQLAALVRLCPNLQSLTLYEVDAISAEQLIGIVNLTPALKRLNIAGCLKMADQPSRQAL
ncbi:MAG: hypothetical protein LLG04_14550, partial [Parachlamydia sp.]|nr:hypothetical protein [Parachlamydia sp.]